MSPQEKRTKTQPGLGKAADERRTTTSEREAQKARVNRETLDVDRPAQSRRPTKGGPPETRRNTSSRGLPAAEVRAKTPPPARKASQPKAARSPVAPARPDTRPPPSAPRTDTRRRSLADRPAVSVDHVGAVVGRASLPQMFIGKAVPRVVRSRAEIGAAPIDHRAGFLLAYIDGATTVQGLIDIDVMPEREVHEILDRLRRLGIVAIR
jgi:hypothetical protein